MNKKIFMIAALIIVIIIIGSIILNNKDNKKEYYFSAYFKVYTQDNFELVSNNKKVLKQDDYKNIIIELLDLYNDEYKYYAKLNNVEIINAKYDVSSNDENNIEYNITFDCNQLDKDNCYYFYYSFLSNLVSKIEVKYNLTTSEGSNKSNFYEK